MMFRLFAFFLCLFGLTGCYRLDAHTSILDKDTAVTRYVFTSNMLAVMDLKEKLEADGIRATTKVLDSGLVELKFQEHGFGLGEANWKCSGLFSTKCTFAGWQSFDQPMFNTAMASMAKKEGRESPIPDPIITYSIDVPRGSKIEAHNAYQKDGNWLVWVAKLPQQDSLNVRFEVELD